MQVQKILDSLVKSPYFKAYPTQTIDVFTELNKSRKFPDDRGARQIISNCLVSLRQFNKESSGVLSRDGLVSFCEEMEAQGYFVGEESQMIPEGLSETYPDFTLYPEDQHVVQEVGERYYIQVGENSSGEGVFEVTQVPWCFLTPQTKLFVGIG